MKWTARKPNNSRMKINKVYAKNKFLIAHSNLNRLFVIILLQNIQKRQHNFGSWCGFHQVELHLSWAILAIFWQFNYLSFCQSQQKFQHFMHVWLNFNWIGWIWSINKFLYLQEIKNLNFKIRYHAMKWPKQKARQNLTQFSCLKNELNTIFVM